MATVLCAVSHVAQVAPADFASHADLLIPFVLETVFHRDSSFNCATRVFGIRTLVRYALSLEPSAAAKTGKRILTFLIKVLDRVGDIEEDEVDRSRLRKAASVGLLRLAQKSHYEALVSPADFLIIARVTRDPCYDVRDSLLKHLTSGCRISALRVRFIALIVLLANDPDRALAKKAKESLAQCVQVLHQLEEQRKGTKGIERIRPEFALPFVLFVISHAFDWKEAALAEHISHVRTLGTFVEQFKKKGPFFYHFFDSMRKTQDIITPECTERMYALCEIGKAAIMGKSPKQWAPVEDLLFVPTNIYRVVGDPEALKRSLVKKYLPSTFRLPASALKCSHKLGYPGHEDVEPFIIDARAKRSSLVGDPAPPPPANWNRPPSSLRRRSRRRVRPKLARSGRRPRRRLSQKR